ncbi:MAG: hypothetical protein GWP91_17070 [Rhodobacterales bacterium]|nr:hypothetical protein [Rhodobacterales bacterium]
MKHLTRSTWSVLLAPLLFGGLLCSPPAAAGAQKKKDTPVPLVVETVDPFSDENLESILNEVQPLVEAAAGRKFKTKPKLVLSEDVDFPGLITAEMQWILGEVMPDTPELMRNNMAAQSGRSMSRHVLGKYGLLSKEVYLPKRLLEDVPSHIEVDSERINDVLRLIIAHEITHALNDQHADLPAQVSVMIDAEQLTAAGGVWEGLATWVEGEVARNLGLKELFWKLNGLQGWGPNGLENVSAWDTWAKYGLGRDFISHHAASGTDALWEPVVDLPASTSMLFRPDTYSSEAPVPPRNYNLALKGVDQKLSKGDWMISNTRLGEVDLRGETIHDESNMEALDAMLSQLVWAQQLDLMRSDREAVIRILEFKDDTGPKQLFELLRAQRKAVNQHASAERGVEIEVITEPFADVEADDAVLRIEKIPIGNGRHIERHAAWVVRGNTVVVVVSERFRPGLRTGWTVEAVFSGLDAL